MESINPISFTLRERTRCTKDEKIGCLPLIDEIVGIAEIARKEGFPAVDKLTETYDNTLLRAGMELVVDKVDKFTIRDSLVDMITMSDTTGVKLLKQYITASGILDIANGDNPRLIRRHLTVLLGEDVYGEVINEKETGGKSQ